MLDDATTLPEFAKATPGTIGAAVDEAIRSHGEAIERLVAAAPRDFVGAWLPFERANVRLDALWSTVSHLVGVVDTPALRAAHAEAEAKLVDHSMRVGQNRELYDLFEGVAASEGFPALPRADRVALAKAIENFRLSGVALDGEARARYREISIELAELSNSFGAAVLDATDAWSELVSDEGMLAGLSTADKAMLAQAAEVTGQKGWLVTLQAPSVNAILSFAEDRDLRERVFRAHGTRASDQGPDAGRFDNGPRIARILELRHEAAKLIGFRDPVEASLATKMAPTPDAVVEYLRDLARRARPMAEGEIAELRAYADEQEGLPEIEAWDAAFVSMRLREARYAIDEQLVREHFPIDAVLSGWKRLLLDLFGIQLLERTDVETWHADVAYYDVADDRGAVFAGVYVDLFARSGKRSGAWMAQARPRLADGVCVMRPVAYLVCNFTPGTDVTPSLLAHGDVQTLLHETGHVLHHLFTEVDRPSIAGTSGFEWDAVELPSQLMEDFAWDHGVLTRMSRHHRTGIPLPTELFEKMAAARRFQSGSSLLRQIEFALFDLLLHLGVSGSEPMRVIEAVRDEVAVLRPPAWHRMPFAFNHIFSGSYAAGYYSYLWAELLAADGFGAFVEAGTLDRTTGDRLRKELLSRGASRPAAESFRAFRGRDPDPNALLARRGLQ